MVRFVHSRRLICSASFGLALALAGCDGGGNDGGGNDGGGNDDGGNDDGGNDDGGNDDGGNDDGGNGGGGNDGGGGGGGAAPPQAPVLDVTALAIKTLRFSWVDVSDASEYRLLESFDDTAPFAPVATIAADVTVYDYPIFLPARINARYILQACNDAGCTDSAAVSVGDTLDTAIGYVKASNTGETDSFSFSLAISGDGSTLAVGAHEEDSNATGIDGNQNNESAIDSGAVYVFVRSGSTWLQQAYIKASNTDEGDNFGFSVSLSNNGNTLAVGAWRESSDSTGINGNQDNNSAVGSGAVYIFTRSGSTWSQQAYIKASNTSISDYFGFVVSLSSDGNTLAVAAPGEDSIATGVNGNEADNSAGESGAVYIFTRGGDNWSQQSYIKASNTGEGDAFGYSLALSGDGNTLVVSAFDEDSDSRGINGDQNNNIGDHSGAAYVFTRSGNTWTQQAYLKESNSDAYDHFGYAVAISNDGNTIAISSIEESSNATGINGNQEDNSAEDSGAVYVFVRSESWSQQAYIKGLDTNAFDHFGWALALSGDGNTLVVGAPSHYSNAVGVTGRAIDGISTGAAYVFTRAIDTWSQQAIVRASNGGLGDEFGTAISLSSDGQTLAVGAYREASNATGIGGNQDDNSAFQSGAVYLY